MIGQLDGLMGLIDGHDRRRRLRWLAVIAVSLAADFGLIFSQIGALQKQRAGQSYAGEALMFALSVGGYLWLNRHIWNTTGEALARAMQTLTERLIERLRRLPLDRFEQIGHADLMSRLTDDNQRVIGAAAAVVTTPQALLRLALGACAALVLSPDFALVAALAMGLMGVAIASRMRVMRQGFGRIARDQMRLYGLLRAQVSAAVPLRLHRGRADAVHRSFTTISSGITRMRVDIFATFFERLQMGRVVLYGTLGINVFLVPLAVTTSNEAIRDINLLLVWVVSSVFGLVASLPDVSRAGDALERLRTLESDLSDAVLEPAVVPSAGGRGRFADFRCIEARGLEFHYPSMSGAAGFSVGPIDLTFHRGRVVFITGFNGSGKSTFLKMLTGLYPPARGALYVDGERIGADDLADFRALFSSIFTDHHLFERAHGLGPDAQLRAPALLEEMDIAHKTALVDGRVTNRDLSAGQKKRLALVLARLEARPVLILDEWAADQDPEYRAAFYRQILPELRAAGRLVIAVTHDDQYFHCADDEVHFDDGLVGPRPADWRSPS